MNKKQLIVVWVIGIYIAVFLSLFALKYYEEHCFPVNLKFRNGNISNSDGTIYFGVLTGESKYFGFVSSLLINIYPKLHQTVWWLAIILPIILLPGGLLIYTLRDKKK